MLQKKVKFNLLTDHGAEELEFMLMYFNKKMDLKTCYLLPNLITILMIFLKPAEVYCIIDKLSVSSKDKVK